MMGNEQSNEQSTGKNPEFLDIFQIDPKEYNKKREEALAKLREKNKKEYEDILWSNKHHPLKASKSRDYRLNDAELSELLSTGLVYKVPKQGSFARQYLDIYNNDLPVIITSDSMLYALHKFYDTFLKNTEQTRLITELKSLCDSMLKSLYQVTPTSENKDYLKQLEVYFMIPRAILMLKNELRPNHVISETTNLIFSLDECKSLLKRVNPQRLDNEAKSGYTVKKELRSYTSKKLIEFVEFVTGSPVDPYSSEMYYIFDTYSQSPKLNAAVNAFRLADVAEPMVFKFGGKQLFADIFSQISDYNQSSEIEFDFCGVTIKMDATQFKPRGHYTESLELQKYFTAFTWLSKFVVSIDRKQDEITPAVVLSSLTAKIAESCIEDINAFQKFIAQIIGESDGYSVQEFLVLINKFIPASNVNQSIDWILKNGSTLADNIFSEPENLKRAKLTKFGDKVGKEMTSIAFSLIGKGNQIDNVVIQRLVDDSVTYDADNTQETLRKFPSAFDVLYTVFGNTSVRPDILKRMESIELSQRDGFKYTGHLDMLKEYVEQNITGTTLYALELKMMRALSESVPKATFPFQSDKWLRKQAQAQLGHYSELRHDNVLYNDEACGGGCECSYPDLLVEPVPAFWREMLVLVKKMQLIVPKVDDNNEKRYRGEDQSDIEVLNNFENILNKFLVYLELQMNGQTNIPLRDELSCIIKITFQGSGPTQYGGWYTKLFHNDDNALEQKPEVCSFFTGVEDERGPGGIVHLGTNFPQLVYVVAKNDENDAGKLFVGPTYRVYEEVTASNVRWNDEEWGNLCEGKTPVAF